MCVYILTMKVRYENQFTKGHKLPEDYLWTAIDFRRRTHEQPHDDYDPPEDEIARITTERRKRLPHIGRGVVTFALAETHVPGDYNPIGCFHAYVMGRRRKAQEHGDVMIDGIWLDPMFRNAGLTLSMAEVGLEVFRADRKIANTDVIMPPLLSGALDNGTGVALWELPAHNPETIEEARLAINAILAPSAPNEVVPARELAIASI